MEHENLHARLVALGDKIHATEERLQQQTHRYRDAAHLTAEELRLRYARLQERLKGEIADAEAHGQHVTALEQSVRQWLDSIDFEHTASK